MPVFEDNTPSPGFATPVAKPNAPLPEPTWGEAFHAAFSLENDVSNAIALMNRPQFEKDTQTYDWISKLKESPYWSDYKENFAGTKNEADFNWRISQIEEERKQRSIIARSGFGGQVAMLAAGAVSPTILLPFLGEERGVAAVARGAQMGLLGGALQELPLQANQQTRTLADFAASVGSSTILSGILGGAAGFMHPVDRVRVEADMALPQKGITISPYAAPKSAGAASAIAEHAGGIDRGPGGGAGIVRSAVDSNPITGSPVVQNLNAVDSKQASFLTAQYSDAGLALEGNRAGIPTTPGGTIENAIQLWNYPHEQVIRAIDEHYSNYFFDMKPPKAFANVLATVGGYFDQTHMTKSEFRMEVGKALFESDTHPNPFIEKVAETVRSKIFDPMLEEAQKTGALDKNIKLLSDPSYARRIYDTIKIKAGVKNEAGQTFKEFLASEFNKKLEADFAKELEKYNTSQSNRADLITDVQRPQAEIDALRKEFTDKLQALESGRNETLVALEDQAAILRAQARKVPADHPDAITIRRDLLDKAKGLEAYGGADLAAVKGDRRMLQRRLRNLNKSQVVLESKHAKKLEKIDRAEELSTNGLNRVAKKGQTVLNKLDQYSDEELNAELTTLKNQFEEVARVYDKGEERIAALSQDEGVKDFVGNEADIQAGLTETGRQEVRADKMTNISEKIADVEDLGRDALRSLIRDALDETIAKVQRINDRRAVRTERLRGQAEKMAPEAIDTRIKAIQAEGTAKTLDFNERMRVMGADSFDTKTGTADFKNFANDAAQATHDKITGAFLRLPTVDVMQDRRGPTLTRVLDIPSNQMFPWMETDVEKIVSSYVKTMGPDIEISRKFGTVNMDEIMKPMFDEKNAMLDAVEAGVDKKGQPLSETAKQTRRLEIESNYDLYKKNLIGVHERLRHTFGLPSDPDGVGYRLGKFVGNLNVLRYMGMVTVSSLPDAAQPIMKYGIGHVFSEAFIPMITNFKDFKLAAREGRYAGVATDSVLGTRPQAVLDVMDNLRRGSKFERGVEYATGKQGLLAGFNIWTDMMKMWTSVSANAKIMDSVARVMSKDDKKAGAYLAQVGIGPQEAAAIWEQAQKAGASEKHNGVWLPNTEVWDTLSDGQRFYRQALAREINRTIVTPGVERPLWTNATQTGRLISQFKSFTFASTQKVVMAGLQQRDAAFLQGVIGSLGMGAMSYYVSSLSSEKGYADMQNAKLGKWFDESISRSGILAVFGLGQDLLSRIPVTAPYSSFSGARTTRRGGDDLLETIAGPSYGDLANKAANILGNIQDPTESTVHKFRQLLPWQNLIWFRSLLDQVEKAAPVRARR